MPIDGFPKSRDDGEQKAFVILDNQAFAKSLAVVTPFAGDGLSHIWNTDLLLEDNGDKLIICASDGKRMARVTLPTSGTKFRTAVAAKSLRSIVNLIAASESLTMTVFNKSVRFDSDGIAVQVQQSAIDYPTVVSEVCDNLLKNCADSVVVNRSTLISELQTAAEVLERDEDGVRMEIKTDPQSLVITSFSKSTADRESAIDVKAKTALPRRRMNHGYVASILRSLDCEDVALFYEPDFKQPAFRMSPVGVNSIETYCVFLKDL
jgi:DNA polymerase III sliding clamp (beta) subunit (PCNA family)